jgi:hypothetical protein
MPADQYFHHVSTSGDPTAASTAHTSQHQQPPNSTTRLTASHGFAQRKSSVMVHWTQDMWWPAQAWSYLRFFSQTHTEIRITLYWNSKKAQRTTHQRWRDQTETNSGSRGSITVPDWRSRMDQLSFILKGKTCW